MTTKNYTQEDCQKMSNQELIETINQFHIYPSRLGIFLKNHYPEILDEVISRTMFIEIDNGKLNIASRLYCIENNIDSIPVCKNPNCKNEVKWNSERKCFHNYCSNVCRYSDPNFFKKVQDTMIKTYGVPFACQNEDIMKKVKETNMQNRGVSYPMQADEVKQKSISTCKRKWNVDNASKSQEVKNKIDEAHMEKYGVKRASQLWSFELKKRATCMQNIGVEFPAQSQEVNEKRRLTCNEKYGADFYAQTHEFHKKCHKPQVNPKYPDMTFGSSWEFKVYDFLMDNHIEFEYQPNISIPYEYNGTQHTYHPDFQINDKIYEVKGEQFFRINEDTGKEEMYIPYRKSEWSEEYYQQLCEKSEAKHQCMKTNNVIILRKHDIESLSIELFDN